MGLYRAEFDNHDCAYALGIPSFGDWRKNREKTKPFIVPRIDQSPVRPRFRLANVYEYALHDALSYNYTTVQSHSIVWGFFSSFRDTICFRLNNLERKKQDIVLAAGPADDSEDVTDPRRVRDPIGYHIFAEFPELAFGPEVLDRSAEREEKPLLFIIRPDARRGTVDERPMPSPDTDFVFADGFEDIRAAIGRADARKTSISGGSTHNLWPCGFVAVNLSELFGDIDYRLGLRLGARSTL